MTSSTVIEGEPHTDPYICPCVLGISYGHMILLILDVNYCNQFYPAFSPHRRPWNEAHLTNVILIQVCGNSTYLSQSHCLIQNLLKGGTVMSCCRSYLKLTIMNYECFEL